MKADKTSHSSGMHDMEKRFWFCPTSSYGCNCGFAFLSRPRSLEPFHIKLIRNLEACRCMVDVLRCVI